MYRTLGWMVALLFLGALNGCGDDSSSDGTGGKQSGSSADAGKDEPGKTPGKGTKPTSDGGSASGAGDAGPGASVGDAGNVSSFYTDAGRTFTADGRELCGVNICDEGGCCQDPFFEGGGRCGVAAGQACLLPPPPDTTSDKRCPGVNVMNIFTIPSCCNDMGQCGIDASMFGGGCVELGEAAIQAEMMGAGNSIKWPPPQACGK